MEMRIPLDRYNVQVNETTPTRPGDPMLYWATMENARVIHTVMGEYVMSRGRVVLDGTPQQLRDLGMMLVKGAEQYLQKEPHEAATSEVKSIVADAAVDGKEVV